MLTGLAIVLRGKREPLVLPACARALLACALFTARMRRHEGRLSDANPDLIKMYQALAENWRAVHRWLRVHSSNHGETYYYDQRAHTPKGRFAQAAWFLYMNRACYNGLYRVNKRGEFNVPKGTKTDVLLSTDNFDGVAAAFRRAKLVVSDFERMIDQSQEGDFVYVDPP